MEDIIKSVKSFLYDRVSSPLFGAFSVAWLFYNYKLPMIIFSDGNVKEKLGLIEQLYSPYYIQLLTTNFYLHQKLLDFFLMPAVMTIGYIYVYPKISLPVYEHSLKLHKLLRSAKQKDDEERLLTEKESREITRQIIQLEVKYNEDISDYQRKIKVLSDALLEKEKASDANNEAQNIEGHIDVRDDLIYRASQTSLEIFKLRDLFDSEEWSSMSSPVRNSIGRIFSVLVNTGKLPDISEMQESSDGIQIYAKKKPKTDSRLPALQEEILLKHAGLNPEFGIVPSEIAESSDIHIEKAKLYLENLDELGLITFKHTSDTNEPAYMLTKRGREYLNKHELI